MTLLFYVQFISQKMLNTSFVVVNKTCSCHTSASCLSSNIRHKYRTNDNNNNIRYQQHL